MAWRWLCVLCTRMKCSKRFFHHWNCRNSSDGGFWAFYADFDVVLLFCSLFSSNISFLIVSIRCCLRKSEKNQLQTGLLHNADWSRVSMFQMNVLSIEWVSLLLLKIYPQGSNKCCSLQRTKVHRQVTRKLKLDPVCRAQIHHAKLPVWWQLFSAILLSFACVTQWSSNYIDSQVDRSAFVALSANCTSSSSIIFA